MNRTSVIKVAIVDDHSVVRMGFKYMLSFAKDISLVGEAAGGENIVELYESAKPDVVLLDVRMPGVDGIAALDALLTAHDDAKVVMLTTSDTEEDIYSAVNRGAKGYILKETNPPDLLEAIRKVARGESCLSPEAEEIYRLRSAEKGLTQREREILQYISKGMSNEEIGRLLGISPNTVKAHIKNIFMTLGVNDRAEAVATGIHRGLIVG